MNFKQSLKESELRYQRLRSRYNDCDSDEGHRKPNVENNYCNHCHRHLEYKTPQADIIREKVQNLSTQFRDYSLIERIELAEIAFQKDDDFRNGLLALEQEKIGSVEFRDEISIYRKRDTAFRISQNT